MAGLPDIATKDITLEYAELHCISNFTFLRGASHPEELVEQAHKLGYTALAITDECSLAGVVRAHQATHKHPIHLIVGSEFKITGLPGTLVMLAPNRQGYAQLCKLITIARRRCTKGDYDLQLCDLLNSLSETTLTQGASNEPETLSINQCLALWALPSFTNINQPHFPSPLTQQIEESLTADPLLINLGLQLRKCFPKGLWLLNEQLFNQSTTQTLNALSKATGIPIVCAGNVHMHTNQRQALQDTLSAIRQGKTVEECGYTLYPNAERYLRSCRKIARIYPEKQRHATITIAKLCHFSLNELRYEYPHDLVPPKQTASGYLRQLVSEGERLRFPKGTPDDIRSLIDKELSLIQELHYEHYFLTIYDIVRFARQQQILCQGRGSAANSVVCYCLRITEVDPTQINLLFERFISKERNEPPDIDVDFEHERREEIIQYIYQTYGRQRTALTATVITYRSKSAIRDVGKALGLDSLFLEQVIAQLDRRDHQTPWPIQLAEQINHSPRKTSESSRHEYFLKLVQEIQGFPRHLSQHVGGFVISAGSLDELVPIENAAMPDRTVIQWNKDDLETLGLLKVDILALGMLSAIRKALAWISRIRLKPFTLSDIPKEDPATYEMLQAGDSIGVFQVESRAQINMLPRLKPARYYDLVIEVAIVRPGPIQGDMVHPYLRRRQGLEEISYPNPEVRAVLERTLGVPIFQEQVIKLAMVAAGFSAGEADQLRRAMASWRRHGQLQPFQNKLIAGMRARGHDESFAERVCQQINGFGEYGFPESHAASFALLVYVSAWLKCHEPAAFYCALLNSQPMGFYSPSQLIQDAIRHHIQIRPVDINASQWDHILESPDQQTNTQPALRLGLRLVKGLNKQSIEKLLSTRPHTGFPNLESIQQALSAGTCDLERLASAGAFASISGHRYQTRWQLAGTEAPPPLFKSHQVLLDTTYRKEPSTKLRAPSEGENTREDFSSTGISLGRHPIKQLRDRHLLPGCLSACELQQRPHQSLVRIAGIVTGRQRPGSAANVTFITLEDETGNSNIVVWQNTAKAQRQVLLTAKLLKVTGILEREGNVIHVIAGRLEDMSVLLPSLQLRSRDFR